MSADQSSPTSTPAVATPADNTPVFAIQRVFMKGASVELPNGPEGFLEQGDSHVNLGFNIDARMLTDGVFEVALRATVETRVKDKVVHLIEVDQSGIFEIRNYPQAELQQILEIAAPRILLPYLRANVADLATRATVNPFHLPDVNWEAQYLERQAQAQKQLEQQAVPASASVH